MMQVGNVNGNKNAVQAVKDTAKQANANTDSVSKEIQGRIANAKSRRQEIASNQRMSEEEKSSERQKIQQEISDLKRQLRQRQLEEQTEKKEADKAARKQEEQEKQVRAEMLKEQQRTTERSKAQREKSSDDTKSPAQESRLAKSSDRRAEDVKADKASDEELRKTQREDMRKGFSKGGAVEQFRVVRKNRQQIDARASVQEAEIRQDEVRGADVEKKVKAQQAETGKKTRQVEMAEDFMFEGKAENARGTNNQAAVGLKGRGLYTDRGTMFGNLFPADKMDVQQ